jgi:hydroxylysine kinase
VSSTPSSVPPAQGALDLAVEDVRLLLRERYGMEPRTVRPVEAELATVCRVEDAGTSYAVKVERAGGPELARLQWRTAVVLQLAAQDLPVPAVRPDRDGSALSCALLAGAPLGVVVEEWLDGVPLEAAAVDRPLLLDVGRTAGRLSAALASAPAPPPGLTHVWEASRGRTSILESLPHVRDPETRELAARAADVFAAEVEPRLGALPRAVVHHDLHDANLLVGHKDGAQRVTGVLDFGDMLAGLRVAELAVAAGYACRLSTDPLGALLDVVEGWGRQVPLEDAEAGVLLPLALTRLAVNASVWAARAAGPRASYAAARSARSLPALKSLLAADGEAVASAVRRSTGA